MRQRRRTPLRYTSGSRITKLLGRVTSEKSRSGVSRLALTLGIPELLEHDFLERPENTLGLGATDIGPVSYGVRELYLG